MWLVGFIARVEETLLKLDIISNSPVIQRIKLRPCIQLLGEEYCSIPYHLRVYRDRKQLEYERDHNPDMGMEYYSEILNGENSTPTGICISKEKKIKIFPFNMDPSSIQALSVVYFTYHELRHAWQHENGLFMGADETRPDQDISAYLNDDAEQDAYEFAKDKMNELQEQILTILQIRLPENVGLSWSNNYKIGKKEK